jgi:hypothetical protein
LTYLTDRTQAEVVLRMIVANTADATILDEDDLRRVRLASGIGVAFDLNGIPIPW